MERSIFKRNQRTKLVGLLTISLLLLCDVSCAFRQVPASPKPIYLGEKPLFEEMKSFQSIVKLAPGSQDYEKSRIEYLFERMKQTRYNFVRNDEVYSHIRALMHLRWKYLRYRSEAATAESYVHNVASGSRITGEPYYLKISDTEFYTIESIFMNELKILDEAIAGYKIKLRDEALLASEMKEKMDVQKREETAEIPLAV